MVCSKCGKKRVLSEDAYDVMGGYKYLPDRQIRARLAVFKKRYCKHCNERYECDYVKYKRCKNK